LCCRWPALECLTSELIPYPVRFLMSRFSNSSLETLKLPVMAVVGIAVCLFLSGMPEIVFADSHGKIRMYKVSSKGQYNLLRWIKDAEVEGCNSSSRDRDVHRFSQSGYNFCQLYSEEDCLPGSEVTAKWGGTRYRVADIDISQPQIKLLRGTKWMLAVDKNVTIQSWYCEY